MAKKQNSGSQDASHTGYRLPGGEVSKQAELWQKQMIAVADRFNREYRGEAFELPEEVEAMPIFVLHAASQDLFPVLGNCQTPEEPTLPGSWLWGQFFDLSLARLGCLFLRARDLRFRQRKFECARSPTQLQII